MRVTSLVLVLIVLAGTSSAQTKPPSFEVASIKPSPKNGFVPPVVSAQSFRIVTTLADAIHWAHEIQGYQLSGGAQWMLREYYQIEGRTSAPATKKEMRAMLQRLLADRFKLKLHSQKKEMPVYALIVGKSGGNSGSKLKTAEKPCGEDGCINVAPGHFVVISARMESIAETLSNMVDRPVLDQTRLTGRYDFDLKFDPSSMKRFDGQTVPGNPTNDPSIFTILQDLGLKLESTRATVDTLVIDGADKPSPN